jgi:hypothetical protein
MKATFIVLAVLLAVGTYWVLASLNLAPSYRCGTSIGPAGPSEVCYWDTRERVY